MSTTQPNASLILYNVKPLSQIVGLASLVGFIFDILILTFPFQLGNLGWRVSFLQQLGDRSIILLFAVALLIYGFIDFTAWRKRLSLVCMGLGVALLLSSVLIISDGLALKDQAVSAISAQQDQLQAQIKAAQENPQANPELTPDRLKQASDKLFSEGAAAKQNAQTQTLKTSASGFGNLFIVGLALVGLGRYGMRPSRN